MQRIKVIILVYAFVICLLVFLCIVLYIVFVCKCFSCFMLYVSAYKYLQLNIKLDVLRLCRSAMNKCSNILGKKNKSKPANLGLLALDEFDFRSSTFDVVK